MIYSRGCEYAIRALAYMANQSGERFISAKEIGKKEGVPTFFLAKTLQKLAQAGVLRSFKGPTGGFGLARSPKQITLYDIVEAIDGTGDLNRCAAGLVACSDAAPCPMHSQFKQLREHVQRYLKRQTVADLAKTVAEKKKLVSKSKSRS